MKLTDPAHLEKIKSFYGRFSGIDVDGYPYFRLIYQLFDLCSQEIFQHRTFGGPFQRVLDLGCGTGHHTVRAAPFCQEIVGLDLSPESLEVARRRVKELGLGNVTFICADITSNTLPDESFDCVIAYGDVIGHIPDYKKMIAEVARVTVPGGLFSLDCDNKWYLGMIREWDELKVALSKLREGHARTWEFQGARLDFNTFTHAEIRKLLADHGFQIFQTYGFDFFPFFVKNPERYQFSEPTGWKGRMVERLNRLDILLRRFWPVNRLGYTKVIFARKAVPIG